MFEMTSRFKSGVRKMFAIRAAHGLLRGEDGSVAVEFALVAAPFLALLFAIMETALVFFAGQTLETAAADSARLILTGQAQTQGLNQASFKTAVCTKVYGLFDCANGMNVDVKKYTSFSAADLSKPLDANGNLVNNFTYQPGGPCEIVVVRLIYQFPVYVSLLGFSLADNKTSGTRLLMATSVFRNEPYQGTCSSSP
jgi:Flp pilus assembly protein TadG